MRALLWWGRMTRGVLSGGGDVATTPGFMWGCDGAWRWSPGKPRRGYPSGSGAGHSEIPRKAAISSRKRPAKAKRVR